MKTFLSWTAVVVVSATVAKHPGGEAMVEHFPDGHIEIASFFDIDLAHLDPASKASRRVRLDNVTVASTATADTIISGINDI